MNIILYLHSQSRCLSTFTHLTYHHLAASPTQSPFHPLIHHPCHPSPTHHYSPPHQHTTHSVSGVYNITSAIICAEPHHIIQLWFWMCHPRRQSLAVTTKWFSQCCYYGRLKDDRRSVNGQLDNISLWLGPE